MIEVEDIINELNKRLKSVTSKGDDGLLTGYLYALGVVKLMYEGELEEKKRISVEIGQALELNDDDFKKYLEEL